MQSDVNAAAVQFIGDLTHLSAGSMLQLLAARPSAAQQGLSAQQLHTLQPFFRHTLRGVRQSVLACCSRLALSSSAASGAVLGEQRSVLSI